MDKYIDAKKLKTKIKERIEEAKSAYKVSSNPFWTGQISAFKSCLNIIDSFQIELIIEPIQEQPKLDLVELEKIIEQTYHDESVADTSNIEPEDYAYIARYFAEWGATHLNARKEESK